MISVYLPFGTYYFICGFPAITIIPFYCVLMELIRLGVPGQQKCAQHSAKGRGGPLGHCVGGYGGGGGSDFQGVGG